MSKPKQPQETPAGFKGVLHNINNSFNPIRDLWGNVYDREKLEAFFENAMEEQISFLLNLKILKIEGVNEEGELLMVLDEERFEVEYLDGIFAYGRNAYAQAFKEDNLIELRRIFKFSVLQYIQGNFNRYSIAELQGIPERELLFHIGLLSNGMLGWGKIHILLDNILSSDLLTNKPAEVSYAQSLERLGAKKVSVHMSLDELLTYEETKEEES